jgi:hypothetical protein
MISAFLLEKERSMSKKNKTQKKFDCPVPEETREHIKSARKEMHKSVESLMPPEFVSHRRAARKEMLMAARSMIDAALERIEA